jgi:hypothetical protein
MCRLVIVSLIAALTMSACGSGGVTRGQVDSELASCSKASGPSTTNSCFMHGLQLAERVCGPLRTVVVGGSGYSTVRCLSLKPGGARAEAAAKHGIDAVKASCWAATGEGTSQLPQGCPSAQEVVVALRRVYAAIQKSCPYGDRAFVNVKERVSVCVPRTLGEA